MDTTALIVAYAEFAGRVHAIADIVTDLTDEQRLDRIRVALNELNQRIGQNAETDR